MSWPYCLQPSKCPLKTSSLMEGKVTTAARPYRTLLRDRNHSCRNTYALYWYWINIQSVFPTCYYSAATRARPRRRNKTSSSEYWRWNLSVKQILSYLTYGFGLGGMGFVVVETVGYRVPIMKRNRCPCCWKNNESNVSTSMLCIAAYSQKTVATATASHALTTRSVGASSFVTFFSVRQWWCKHSERLRSIFRMPNELMIDHVRVHCTESSSTHTSSPCAHNFMTLPSPLNDW
jgi:hypothetical protein